MLEVADVCFGVLGLPTREPLASTTRNVTGSVAQTSKSVTRMSRQRHGKRPERHVAQFARPQGIRGRPASARFCDIAMTLWATLLAVPVTLRVTLAAL